MSQKHAKILKQDLNIIGLYLLTFKVVPVESFSAGTFDICHLFHFLKLSLARVFHWRCPYLNSGVK